MSAPITCKAAVTWEPGATQVIEDVIIDAPQPNEVRIKMVAASICRSDVSKWKGNIAPECEFPLVAGHEGAGIVEAVGSEVNDLKPGDHVIPSYMPFCGSCSVCTNSDSNQCDKWPIGTCGRRKDGSARVTCKGKPLSQFLSLGTFAEFILADSSYITKVDDTVPLDKVCPVGCGVGTGYGSAINTAKVSKGDTVAVFGLGCIGLSVLMGAKDMEASKIIAVDTNPTKFELAKKLGATDCVNPKDHDKPIEQVIHSMTNGGVKHGFECVGNVKLMESVFASTKEAGGTTVLLGVDKDGTKVCFNPAEVLFGRKITGATFGGFKGRKDIPTMVQKYMDGKLKIDYLITHNMKLDDINKTFDMIQNGESIRTVINFE